MISKKVFLFVAMAVSIAYSCQSNDPLEDISEDNLERNIELFPNLISDSLTWDTALKELETSADAKAAFDHWITKPAEEAMSHNPYSVKSLDGANQAECKQSANDIYNIAVSWLFMDKQSILAQNYLNKATSLILKWALVNEPTNHTPNESLLTPIYEAYSIIRKSINESDRKQIDQWIKMRANYYKNLNLTGNLLENNWNTIRLNFLFYFAQILEDELLYNYSVSKFKSHIELNILSSGISHDFVNRDALTYHAYNLLFYSRILKSATIYKNRDAALQLYHLKNSKGSSVEDCVNFWEPYLLDPENNVHLEFVNTSWEPDKNQSSYNKPYNPNGTLYVLDELSYIEPRCNNYIESITTGNHYSRTFKYWINSIE
uniref:alginate lyase family protein n=1 Tax=uncultured Draconibacterium sp. TaxID=1573823 RepID=UPI0032165B3D